MEFLSELPDSRRAQGTRFRYDSFVCMIIMGYMGGHYSGQSLGRFFNNNKKALVKLFHLNHGVPGATRINTFIKDIDFKLINQKFYMWVDQYENSNHKWVSIDGKVLRNTLIDVGTSRQCLLSMVGAFVQQSGLTIFYSKHKYPKTNEQASAREIIREMKDKGYIFTLDALHCEKKQLKQSWSQEMALSFK